MTVCKALKNDPSVSTSTKKKVHDTADKIGYNKIEHLIGVVIPSLENNFFSYAVQSIADVVSKYGYNVFVTESRENQKSERLNIESLIKMRVDGLLVCVSQETKDLQIFESAVKMNIPIVFFDRKLEGINFPSVVFDDRNGGISALNKIINLGYSKIAHFAGYSNVSIGKERHIGYRHALEKKGMEIKPEWVIEGGFEIKDGYEAFNKLYYSQKLPEVIFTVNDRVALGVYKAAREKDIKIPDDLGIVGYGFIETAKNFYPSLSIINQDPRKIGTAAANLITEMIANPDTKINRNVIINEEFFWNNSIRN